MTAKKDTVNIHGKEYETVSSRVQRFRNNETYKDYGIIPEILSIDQEYVVVKASIYNTEGRLLATGHAEEKRGSSNINKTSALENCETSAIGRALAAFGFAGTEYASADEVANAVAQQNNFTPTKQLSGNITDKQVGLIEAKSNGMKLADPELHTQFAQWYKTTMDNKPFKALTKAQASQTIDRLMGNEPTSTTDNIEEYSGEVF